MVSNSVEETVGLGKRYQANEQSLREQNAGTYDLSSSKLGLCFELRERKLFADAARARPIESALEIGCGTGRISEVVAPRVGHLTALDFSASSLELLRKKQIRNVTPKLADVCRGLSYPAGTFDFVFACQVFQHFMLDDLLRVLKECRRVLRSSGQLCFSAYNLLNYSYKYSFEELPENGLYSKRFSRGYVGYLASQTSFRVQTFGYYKGTPNALAKCLRSHGLVTWADQVVCGIPLIGSRVAAYLFTTLSPI